MTELNPLWVTIWLLMAMVFAIVMTAVIKFGGKE